MYIPYIVKNIVLKYAILVLITTLETLTEIFEFRFNF